MQDKGLGLVRGQRFGFYGVKELGLMGSKGLEF